MVKVLFVCLGNICRSPLAEAVFNKLIAEKGLTRHISCDSAGTSDYHIGEPPDRRTLDMVGQYKLHLDHRGRQFSIQDFTDFDYIITMDRRNREDVKALMNHHTHSPKVFLMRNFDDRQEEPDVPDPYWSGKEGFEHVYQILQRSCQKLLAHIVREHKLGSSDFSV